VQQKSEDKGSGVEGKDTGARHQQWPTSRRSKVGAIGADRRDPVETERVAGQSRSTNVDVNVNRGRHGFKSDRRTRVGVDVECRRGFRSGDVGVRQSYGYSAGNCQEILRRYRQCVAR